MRILSAAALLLAVVTSISAQTSTPPQTPAKGTSSKLVTLVGCITSDDTVPGQYTIVDTKGAALYRLSGTDMHTYIGQRVEVTGGSPRRFRIAGGLVPSPNAAAQAGAVDPPPAAATGPSKRNDLRAPEFRVKMVKTVTGTCP